MPPTPEELKDLILRLLDDDQAEELVTIPLAGKSAMADFMILGSGRSARHLGAMAEHVTALLKAHGLKGLKPEGVRQGEWVLIDAGDIIVHLFRPEMRQRYNLEKIWDATITEPDSPGAASSAET